MIEDERLPLNKCGGFLGKLLRFLSGCRGGIWFEEKRVCSFGSSVFYRYNVSPDRSGSEVWRGCIACVWCGFCRLSAGAFEQLCCACSVRAGTEMPALPGAYYA